MVKYKVEVNRSVCIATGACYATDTLHYQSDRDQKAKVIGGETDDSKSTRTFDDDRLADAEEGARMCPVSAITVSKLGLNRI